LFTGYPRSSIQWLKNGQEIHFNSRIRLEEGVKLFIHLGLKEDQGIYQCVVKNEFDMSQGSAELLLGGTIIITLVKRSEV